MKAADVFSLAGKVVMITGASSGFGERFAEVAAANGARVVLVARRPAVLETVKARIEAAGGEALVAAADVTDDVQMAAAFDAAESAFGVVDVFVANAGIGSARHAMQTDRAEWRRVMATDLDAVFFGAQEAARRLIAKKHPGVVIVVASIAGLMVASGLTPYSVAKAGVLHATRLLALDLAPHGIRVNALAPGYIVTNLNRDFLTGPDGQAMIAKLPMTRMGEPKDLDGAFLLLASDASSLMTGSTIVVDSGHTLPPVA